MLTSCLCTAAQPDRLRQPLKEGRPPLRTHPQVARPRRMGPTLVRWRLCVQRKHSRRSRLLCPLHRVLIMMATRGMAWSNLRQRTFMAILPCGRPDRGTRRSARSSARLRYPSLPSPSLSALHNPLLGRRIFFDGYHLSYMPSGIMFRIASSTSKQWPFTPTSSHTRHLPVQALTATSLPCSSARLHLIGAPLIEMCASAIVLCVYWHCVSVSDWPQAEWHGLPGRGKAKVNVQREWMDVPDREREGRG